MTAADFTETAEAEIRAVIADRIEAMRNKDAEATTRSLSADVVAFEMVPPLSLPPGAAADADAMKTWFAGWTGPVEVEVRDLKIHAAGDVAFSHSLNRLSGTIGEGRKVDMWMRSTFGFRKAEGKWKIVHSHTSVPFKMDGTFQAALDLMP